jgi:hypothetical protein
VAAVWWLPSEQAQHTGAQSRGLVQADPGAPPFQSRKPATEAQVLSTFSLMLVTEFCSVAIAGPVVHVAGGGAGLLDPLPEPQAPQHPAATAANAAPRANQ